MAAPYEPSEWMHSAINARMQEFVNGRGVTILALVDHDGGQCDRCGKQPATQSRSVPTMIDGSEFWFTTGLCDDCCRKEFGND